MFLKNSWYVAAFDTEIGHEPLARTLLNEPVVLFRTEDGTPVALEDRCCHRALPLSMGKVIGNDIQCGYHGLTFDASGTCVSVPGQNNIPPGAAVRAYPVVERLNWIWIWMGDPALADESLIPDWWWADHPDWACIKGRDGEPLYVKCNYELITDNLMDVSHLSYVHTSSIGTGAVAECPPKTERSERRVTASRWVPDKPAAPFYQKAANFKGNVDRWLITVTDLPCFTMNDAGSVDLGTDASEGHRDAGVEMRVLNAPTPETETTTHYFYQHARGFEVTNPEWDEIYRTQFTEVFLEDKVILEAQQASLNRDPDGFQIDINDDAPCIAVRRALRDLIEAEQTGNQAAAAE
ncbi:MAG: aromatic ring-hydroxylating dioxygenase subunit alpha [Rhodospirillaceae bacterium]|nr:aromatic ring-hydroxylating dioxygenase subunit alpha [Rhodospirillaceae bacterium]